MSNPVPCQTIKFVSNNFASSASKFRFWKSLSLALLCAAALISFTGCSGTTDSESAGGSEPVTENKDEPKTTSVVPAESTTTRSPAISMLPAGENLLLNAKPELPFDKTPDGVCKSFMELLQADNRRAAANLLTHRSISNITSAGLKLEPMGGPNAKFTIGQMHFATTKKRLAQVECLIKEKVGNENVAIKISWQVKKFGEIWRISGVILEAEPGQAPDLLSFENILDVAKIQSLAGEDVINEEPTRQASRETEIK